MKEKDITFFPAFYAINSTHQFSIILFNFIDSLIYIIHNPLRNKNQKICNYWGGVPLPTPPQWAEKGGQEQFPDAKSLLSGDYVHYVDSNEL